MGLGGAQVLVAGREFGHAVHANAQTRHSKEEIPMVAMLMGGHVGA